MHSEEVEKDEIFFTFLHIVFGNSSIGVKWFLSQQIKGLLGAT